MRCEPLIRRVRPGDAELLAPLMREADVAEVRAGGREPLEALKASLQMSVMVGVLELGGELAAIFGVVPGPRETLLGPRPYDIAWCLTGRAVNRFPIAFVRASREVISDFLSTCPVLFNAIDARYAAAVRWAAVLGAEVGPAQPWGASGLPFHPCFWRA